MATTELKGGLLVQTDAILLALALEAHGHALTAKDGALLVTNGSTLSAEDRTAIQAHKRHLLAIAAYVPPQDEAASLVLGPSGHVPPMEGPAPVPQLTPPGDTQLSTHGDADVRQSGKASVRRAREHRPQSISLFPEAE